MALAIPWQPLKSVGRSVFCPIYDRCAALVSPAGKIISSVEQLKTGLITAELPSPHQRHIPSEGYERLPIDGLLGLQSSRYSHPRMS